MSSKYFSCADFLQIEAGVYQEDESGTGAKLVKTFSGEGCLNRAEEYVKELIKGDYHEHEIYIKEART